MDYISQLDPLILIPLALVIILMALPHVSRHLKGKVAYIQTGELNNLLARESPVVMIDIRSEKDFRDGYIEGAINVSKADLEAKLKSGASDLEGLKSQMVVIICKSDLESIKAARSMEAQGFNNISVLQGGFFRWKRDRCPVKKGKD